MITAAVWEMVGYVVGGDRFTYAWIYGVMVYVQVGVITVAVVKC